MPSKLKIHNDMNICTVINMVCFGNVNSFFLGGEFGGMRKTMNLKKQMLSFHKPRTDDFYICTLNIM